MWGGARCQKHVVERTESAMGGKENWGTGKRFSILNKTPRVRGGQRELSTRQGGQRELSTRRGKAQLKKKPLIRLGARDDLSSSVHYGLLYDSSIILRARVWGAKRTELAAGWAKRTEHAAGWNWTKKKPSIRLGARDDLSSSLHDGLSYDRDAKKRARVTISLSLDIVC